jgi:hypothetical protein
MFYLARFPILFAAVSTLVFMPVARAQDDSNSAVTEKMLQRSHLWTRDLGPPKEYGERIESLMEKWKGNRDQDVIQRLIKGQLNPKNLKPEQQHEIFKRLRSKLPPGLVSPEVKKALEDLEHDRQLSPQQVQELQNWSAELSHPKPLDAQEKGQKADRSQPEAAPAPESDRGSPNTGRRLGGGNGPTLPSVNFSTQEQGYAQRVMNWINTSPAMRRALRDLSRRLGGDDPRWKELATRFDSIRTWGNGLSFRRVTTDDLASWIGGALPELGPLGQDAGSLQSDGTTELIPGLPAERSFVILGLLVVGILAAALIAGRTTLGRRQDPGWILGPWPVNPAAVLNRDDLVQAFEHLSLLRLGPDSRNWNHRVIADHLLDPIPERRSEEKKSVRGQGSRIQPAVTELASLYEHARYAPPDEVLSEQAVLAARRHLRLLAGDVPA